MIDHSSSSYSYTFKYKETYFPFIAIFIYLLSQSVFTFILRTWILDTVLVRLNACDWEVASEGILLCCIVAAISHSVMVDRSKLWLMLVIWGQLCCLHIQPNKAIQKLSNQPYYRSLPLSCLIVLSSVSNPENQPPVHITQYLWLKLPFTLGMPSHRI